MPPTPPEIAPVVGSIVAPSPGSGLKLKLPPAVPEIVATAAVPWQKSAIANVASS